jgi:hypothetical protein
VITSGCRWLHRGPLGFPQASGIGLRSLGGGLRSWLGARWTCAPALYLTAPPSCGRFALYRETQGDAGGFLAAACEARNGIPARRGPFKRAEPAASGR